MKKFSIEALLIAPCLLAARRWMPGATAPLRRELVSGCTFSRRWSCAALWCVGVVLAPVDSANATMPDSWKDITYSQVGATATVAQTLSEFAKAMGLRLDLPTELAQTSSERVGGATSPGAFLDRLAMRHYLTWFVYGGVLHVDSAPQIAIQRVELHGSTGATAKQALIGIGLFETKFGWGELDSQPPAVILSGPQAYIDLVRGAIERLTENDGEKKEAHLMVFQLKHASVGDYESTVRDKVTVRQGVASMLRSLVADNGTRDGALGRSPLESFRAPVQPVGKGPATIPTNWGEPPNLGRRASLSPAVEAFPETNSIVVRDALNRRPMYEQLIAALDQPAMQIEILASVVDAEVGTLHEWSMDVRLGGRNGSGIGLLTPAHGTLTQPTVVLWASSVLDVRLKALESDGKVKVVSRPSILTLNNQGATLDLSKTTYVKLEGERVADLRAITVGSMLSVVPRIVSTQGNPSILLSINIEDGSIDSSQVLPVASRNSINTQALVGGDQALVIGGYQQDNSELRKSSIPGLSKLPIVGGLFQGDLRQKSSRERLYIISAHIIAPPEGTVAKTLENQAY